MYFWIGKQVQIVYPETLQVRVIVAICIYYQSTGGKLFAIKYVFLTQLHSNVITP